MSDVLPNSGPSITLSDTLIDRSGGQSCTIRAVQNSPKRWPTVQGQSGSTKDSNPGPRRVRFEDFPLPLASTHPKNGLALPSTAHVQQFRSAALGSLLPIAASQGIAQPLDLDRAGRSSHRSPPPLIVKRLYTQGEVCRHRTKESDAKVASKDRDVLTTAMAATDPVDGAVEISEKKDVCWRCAVRSGFHVTTDLLLHCACAKTERESLDEQDNEAEGRPAWNNV
jgi:hypothetical protein